MYTGKRGNIENLRRLAYNATPAQVDAALSWYPAARVYCAEAASELGVRTPVFTAVTAAISCMRSWVRNIADAAALTTWYAAGLDYRSAPIPKPAGCGPLRMAYRVLWADDPGELSGPKVRAFFACISWPECNEVVIDSHAYAAWIGSGAGSLTFAPGARRACAADYRALARELQIPAPATQALIWIVHKAQ
jgi:hypothetical protein